MDWLASRPYVRHGSVGLYLHDLVREPFQAEFRHRSPDAYLELHRTVRGYFEQRLADPAELHPERTGLAEIVVPVDLGVQVYADLLVIPMFEVSAQVRGAVAA